jgi:hypothetical protein
MPKTSCRNEDRGEYEAFVAALYADLAPADSVADQLVQRTGEMIALSRYEAALDRSMGRAYALLDRRQVARRIRRGTRDRAGRRRRCSAPFPNRSRPIRLSHSGIKRIMKVAKRSQFSIWRQSRVGSSRKKALSDAAKCAASTTLRGLTEGNMAFMVPRLPAGGISQALRAVRR